MPVRYEVDSAALSQLQEDNFNHPVLCCLSPHGEVLPGKTATLEWIFSPLEAKMYHVRNKPKSAHRLFPLSAFITGAVFISIVHVFSNSNTFLFFISFVRIARWMFLSMSRMGNPCCRGLRDVE